MRYTIFLGHVHGASSPMSMVWGGGVGNQLGRILTGQNADVLPVLTWGYGMTAGQTMRYDELLKENGGWEKC